MRALSAMELLEIWEQGLAQGPVERALALLASACPESSPDKLARLSIGRRDSDLLTLRERTFGPRMSGIAPCPQCGERLEFSFNTADLRVDSRLDQEAAAEMSMEGYELRFRPLNSQDLAMLAQKPDTESYRRGLLDCCILAAHREGEPVAVDGLPEPVIDALEQRMAHVDPQADVRLEISCPTCGHRWQGLFDIVAFFWGEIESWAVRMLHEVHTLASAYGWSEREILALSAGRRQFYLEMVGG